MSSPRSVLTVITDGEPVKGGLLSSAARKLARALVVVVTTALVASGAQLMPARAAISGATLIRTILTSNFQPPSPDPSGVAFNSAVGELIISDGEVEEMGIWSGNNLWQISLDGSVTHKGNTIAYTREPTGVSFNPANRHLFVSDDNKKTIHQIDAGTDGKHGTPDDTIVSKIQTDLFASTDPEDVSYAPEVNHLFIIDGKDTQVFDVSPGPNGVFDGVAPGGDDSVTNFDVGDDGLADPEGIAYNSERGTLFVVDDQTGAVYEFTVEGELLNQINIAQARARKAAGITFGPSSTEEGRTNMYIVDRGVDNNNNPEENDGKLYEMSFDLAPIGSEPFLVELPVSQPADDAEQGPFGAVNVSSDDLELVQETLQKKPQIVALRFRGVPVPPDATILSAEIQFQTDEKNSIATSLTIAGEAVADSAPLAPVKFDLSSRPRTAASVSWSPIAWTVVGAHGSAQRTPDLSAVVQEIVDGDGWAAGNSFSLIITGTGRRCAESVEGGVPPVLTIEYST